MTRACAFDLGGFDGLTLAVGDRYRVVAADVNGSEIEVLADWPAAEARTFPAEMDTMIASMTLTG